MPSLPIPRACPVCHRTFSPTAGAVRRGYGKYCSRSCSNQARALPFELRFWRRVEKTDGCWLWLGTCYPNGYGHLHSSGSHGKTILAHRAVYELTFGAIPEGLCVLHHCDNRRCVNPTHLFLGTKKDNTQDMLRKGRHHHVDLTEQQKADIRRRHIPRWGVTLALAREFGISTNTVRRIVSDRR